MFNNEDDILENCDELVILDAVTSNSLDQSDLSSKNDRRCVNLKIGDEKRYS